MSTQPCNTQCSDFTIYGWEESHPYYEPTKQNPNCSHLAEKSREYTSNQVLESVKKNFYLSCGDCHQVRTAEKITKLVKKEIFTVLLSYDVKNQELSLFDLYFNISVNKLKT